MIAFARSLARERKVGRNTMASRLKQHRFHAIEAATVTAKLRPLTKVHPDWELLCLLRDGGRTVASAWLQSYYGAVGHRSTADIGGCGS